MHFAGNIQIYLLSTVQKIHRPVVMEEMFPLKVKLKLSSEALGN